jgi:hypothetical protein
MSNTDEIITTLTNKISILEKEMLKYKKIETLFVLEKLKNKMFSQIIYQKLKINFEDIVEEKEDGFHFYEIEKSGGISIHIHEHLKKESGNIVKYKIKNEEETLQIDENIKEEERVNKPKKYQYRPIKLNIEKIDIEPDHANAPIVEKSPFIFYEEDEDEKDDNEIDIEKIQAILCDCFDSLKTTNKSYTKILENIKTNRNKLLPVVSIQNYIDLINTHNNKITEVFKLKENQKKINILVGKSMSAIDMRLVFFTDYDKYHLETDDILKLKKSLIITADHCNEYRLIDYTKFYNNLYNYTSVLFSIKENISRFLVNKNGFFNIIYLPLPKSSDKDPYSFYILEKITKKHREWKMDCRLESLSNNLIHNIRPFLIKTFRTIYNDIFHDNIYRSNFGNKSQIIDCDCEQLIRNILTLIDPIIFTRLLRSIIKEKSSYIPTEYDKFNLKGDDNFQKKTFETYKPNENDNLNLVKTMFDDMTTADALDFYRQKSQNLLLY